MQRTVISVVAAGVASGPAGVEAAPMVIVEVDVECRFDPSVFQIAALRIVSRPPAISLAKIFARGIVRKGQDRPRRQ